jgi:hypothetical protein
VAKKHPTDEIPKNSKPIMSNDLCLKRTLRNPMINAKTTAATEEKVLICPIIPTSTLNSAAIGYRKSPIKTASGPAENMQKINVGRKIFFGEVFSLTESASSLIFRGCSSSSLSWGGRSH